jgi:putative FmdB family regulatory protein
MPIYEYQCRKCGHQLEVLQRITDNPMTECPSCGKAELQKLISESSFQLKGTGWYATDFKNIDKKPEPNKVSANESTATEATDKTKTSETSTTTETKTTASDTKQTGDSSAA